MSKIKTVQQHILDEERLYPGATGDFTALLTSLTLAAKIISREVNQAGLVRILGETGEINVHGEAVQKLIVATANAPRSVVELTEATLRAK